MDYRPDVTTAFLAKCLRAIHLGAHAISNLQTVAPLTAATYMPGAIKAGILAMVRSS